MYLLQMAIAPVLICFFYVYIRDRYEKEPVRLLCTGIILGAYMTVPIICIETILALFTPSGGLMMEAFYDSFVVAAFTEELVKFVFLYFLVWRNRNFNEPFDGIVYATFISLGFAGVENILYVFNEQLGGVQTALVRAVLSVPGHGFFGVMMGYYFAMARFEKEKETSWFLKAFFMPYIVHSLYDFILLSGFYGYMFLFIPLVIFIWLNGFKKMRVHLAHSPFKN